MEIVSFGLDVLQNIAEHAASYRPGQSVLRQLDRGLWVIEKCARWAVPPPLDQDERPQPELVRPLPWVFFLMMLVAMRFTREAISLLNLVMGKPPLRSADVVMFIQSKRRYLRTLKYQGNRIMRARTSVTPAREPWYNSLYKLFELTMCFRRESNAYGNNNTTRVSNNDEVMVVKRSKRGRQETSPVVSNETMERLIEKMMVDLDAESDEDSNFTLTNVTSSKSDRSDCTPESDSETTLQNETATPTKLNGNAQNDDIHFSPTNNVTSSTPEKHNNHTESSVEIEQENTSSNSPAPKKEIKRELENDISGIPSSGKSQIDKFRDNLNSDSPNNSDYISCDEAFSPAGKKVLTTKQASENLILTETQRERTPKKEHKIGRKFRIWSVNLKKLFVQNGSGYVWFEADTQTNDAKSPTKFLKRINMSVRAIFHRDTMAAQLVTVTYKMNGSVRLVAQPNGHQLMGERLRVCPTKRKVRIERDKTQKKLLKQKC